MHPCYGRYLCISALWVENQSSLLYASHSQKQHSSLANYAVILLLGHLLWNFSTFPPIIHARNVSRAHWMLPHETKSWGRHVKMQGHGECSRWPRGSRVPWGLVRRDRPWLFFAHLWFCLSPVLSKKMTLLLKSTRVFTGLFFPL